MRATRLAPRARGMARDFVNRPVGEAWIRQRYAGLTRPLTAQLALGRHAYLLAGPLIHALLHQKQISQERLHK